VRVRHGSDRRGLLAISQDENILIANSKMFPRAFSDYRIPPQTSSYFLSTLDRRCDLECGLNRNEIKALGHLVLAKKIKWKVKNDHQITQIHRHLRTSELSRLQGASLLENG